MGGKKPRSMADQKLYIQAQRVWINWIKTSAGKTCSDPTTLRPVPEHTGYLQNRLREAFQVGVDTGIRLARLKAVEQFSALISMDDSLDEEPNQ